MAKYTELGTFIINNIGGKDNINRVTHCMTRLRFNLNDFTQVNEEKLLESTEIITVQKSGGQYQVVIGTHVSQIYKEILNILGISETGSENVEEERKSLLNRLTDTITKVITPAIGILTACGLIQGMLALLTAIGIVNQGDGAYIVLHGIGQTIFYFFPIILGYSSAKAFKLDPFIGMILGASLVIPELVSGISSGATKYTLFNGTFVASEIKSTFFGIPIMFPANGYSYTVIPIIFSTFFGSKVEAFLKKKIPSIIGFTLIPFFTILVTVPITLLLIGPITNLASDLISSGTMALYGFSPVLTAAFVAIIYQPMVILGLHWPIITLAINNLTANGHDFIQSMWFPASFAQTAVVLAVFLRTKSKKRKALSIPAMISGAFCIIEPAIYGFTLPVLKRFVYSIIGGTVGSVLLILANRTMYAHSFGVLGFASFINPNGGQLTDLVFPIFVALLTMVISFSLTYFTFNEDPADKAEFDKNNKKVDDLVISMPIEGEIFSLSKSSDLAFAEGLVGEGVMISPKNGEVFAPCDGKVVSILPSKHAIGIESDTGIEILIHVGVNTVELNGEGFEAFVNIGDSIKNGTLLLKFDIEYIESKGYSTETIVVVTNLENERVIIQKSESAEIGEQLFKVIPTLINNNQEGGVLSNV